jgi:uncharacterized membrane protein YgdD (TMEM256/DUF423 family)
MRLWLVLAALNGLVGVAAGAASAHALASRLDAAELGLVQQAALYQILHALALLGVAALVERRASLRLGLAGLCFALGSVGFAGGIYLRVLGGIAVGPAIPIGGTLFMAGWALLLTAAFGRR